MDYDYDDEKDYDEKEDNLDGGERFTKEGEVSRISRPMMEGEELITDEYRKTPEGRYILKLYELAKDLKIDMESPYIKSIKQNFTKIPKIIYKNPYVLLAAFYVLGEKKGTKMEKVAYAIKKFKSKKSANDLDEFNILRYMELIQKSL